MHRALVIASLCCACGGPSSSGTIANRAAAPAVAACPTDPAPFAPGAPAAADDECIREGSSPMLTADAAAPTCHVYQPSGARDAAEAVSLTDGRRVWIGQSGCVHASIEIRGRPAHAVAAGDRAAVLTAAAELLTALDAHASERTFAGFARDLTAAAPAAPTGSFPLGSGDWTAEVELGADGALTILLDFPL